MKKIIRLAESDLHRIIKETVKRILKESPYEFPNGGFDSYAYKYDNALNNAQSIEDWDEKMKNRNDCVNRKASVALNRHPQRINKQKTGGLGASEYAHPDWFLKNDDNVLDMIKYDAKYGKREYGFPF